MQQSAQINYPLSISESEQRSRIAGDAACSFDFIWDNGIAYCEMRQSGKETNRYLASDVLAAMKQYIGMKN